MNLNVSKYASLNFATYVKAEDMEFWTPPKYREYNVRQDDEYYEVKSYDRIDLLAYRFYGNVELWRYLAHVNELYNLPTDLRPGMLLRIPPKHYIVSKIVGG